MNIAMILRRATLISAATVVCAGMFAPAGQALVSGELGSTEPIQKYNKSLRTGLADYMGVLAPVQTPNGNLRLVAVKTDSTIHLVTLAPDGALIKSTPISDSFSTYQLAVDSHGAVYIGFSTEDSSRLLKYDESHSVTLEIPIEEGLSSITVDIQDNIYVSTATQVDSTYAFVIKKYSPNGTLLSTSPPVQHQEEYPTVAALQSTPDGNLLASLISSSSTNYSTSLVKMTSSGSILKTLVTTVDTPTYSMSTDTSGNIYLPITVEETAGHNDPCEGLGMAVELRKYSPDGNLIGTIDTSASTSEGPICPVYGAGTANPRAASITSTRSGDLFIGTGDFTGNSNLTRIAVYSYPSTIATFAPNSYTVKAKLNVSGGAELAEATNNALSDIGAPQDGGNVFPLGLVRFNAKVKDTQPVQIDLLFATDLKPSQVTPRKYHSGKKTYGDVPGAVITQSELDGKPALKLSYNISDGGEMDEDGVVNGTIVDPVGLAVAEGVDASSSTTVGAPNTGYAKHNGSNIAIWSLFGGAVIFLSFYLVRKPVLSQKRIAASRRNSRR